MVSMEEMRENYKLFVLIKLKYYNMGKVAYK
jgi:hypothetical protein